MASKIQIKRGTTAQWADSSTNDITLAPGQPGVEYCEDGKVKLKIGLHTEDGSSTEWDKIPYISAEGAEMIKTSATGKNYTISDCAEETIVSLNGYGESVQDGTPTPDSPVEIVSVENPVISVYGKNLFDKDNPNKITGYFTAYGGAISSDPSTRSIYIACNPNTTYTASKITSARFVLGFTSEVPAGGVEVNGVAFSTSGVTTLTSTSPADAKYLVVWFYHQTYDTSITEDEIMDSIQVELGSVATPYEPYIEPQTITIPYTFRGLKNLSGDWVARDELRVEGGKVEIVRNIQTYTFTGQENIKEYFYNNDYDTYTRHFQFGRLFGYGNNPPIKTPVLNEKFISGGVMNALDTSFLTTGYNAPAFHLYAQISKQLFSDSSTNYTEQLAQMLQGTNLYAVNPNPTVEDITNTEAGQALLALKTNYPSTSVISDIDLNLTYRADTKNYIDNKIAALTALTLEG